MDFIVERLSREVCCRKTVYPKIRLFFTKLLQKNEVINSYFESKSNPFSIFNKNIDGKMYSYNENELDGVYLYIEDLQICE